MTQPAMIIDPNDIREFREEYSSYVAEQRRNGLEASEYDTWAKHEMERRKAEKVGKRQNPKVSHKEHTIRLRLVGDLVSILNAYHERAARLIWNKNKAYDNWTDQGHALDMTINEMRAKMQETIKASGVIKDEGAKND